jgi:hypothetical protein
MRWYRILLPLLRKAVQVLSEPAKTLEVRVRQGAHVLLRLLQQALPPEVQPEGAHEAVQVVPAHSAPHHHGQVQLVLRVPRIVVRRQMM